MDEILTIHPNVCSMIQMWWYRLYVGKNCTNFEWTSQNIAICFSKIVTQRNITMILNENTNLKHFHKVIIFQSSYHSIDKHEY